MKICAGDKTFQKHIGQNNQYYNEESQICFGTFYYFCPFLFLYMFCILGFLTIGLMLISSFNAIIWWVVKENMNSF